MCSTSRTVALGRSDGIYQEVSQGLYFWEFTPDGFRLQSLRLKIMILLWVLFGPILPFHLNNRIQVSVEHIAKTSLPQTLLQPDDQRTKFCWWNGRRGSICNLDLTSPFSLFVIWNNWSRYIGQGSPMLKLSELPHQPSAAYLKIETW